MSKLSVVGMYSLLTRGKGEAGVKKLLALLALLVAMLISCSPRYKFDVQESESVIDFGVGNYTAHYEVVEIEGMPCIVCKQYYGLAITCDWSQYTGQHTILGR